MRRSSSFFFGALATVLFGISMSACGARSSLFEKLASEAAGGEGGGGASGGGGSDTTTTTTGATTTATTTTTTTTTTTSITATGPCSDLTLLPGFMGVGGGDGANQTAPSLASIGTDDGAPVSVAMSWQFVNQTPHELRHAVFSPWPMWPGVADVGNINLADFDGGESFASAAAPAGKLALLFKDFNGPPQGGFRISDDFVPGMPGIPMSTLVDDNGDRALFLSGIGDFYAFGIENLNQNGDKATFRLGAWGPGVNDENVVGCAAQYVSAGAAPSPAGDSWIWAGAIAEDPSECGPGMMVGSLPTRLMIGEVTNNAGLFVSNEITNGGVIGEVFVAPSPKGAWVVWTGVTDALPQPMSAVHVDEFGTITANVNDVLGGIEGGNPMPGTISVAGFDGFLAIAWQEFAQVPVFTVRIVAPDGQLTGKISVQPQGFAEGRTALLGRDDLHSVVLAWSERTDPNDEDLQMRFARIDCLNP